MGKVESGLEKGEKEEGWGGFFHCFLRELPSKSERLTYQHFTIKYDTLNYSSH